MSRAGYDFYPAYQRVLDVTGASSQSALAAALGISQAGVWDVIRRAEGIPASWLVTLVEKYGVSPLWIKFGQEPQRLSRSLGEVSLEELMAEAGRRQDVIYKRCAGSGVTAAAEG
jgi:plasmid maintenance system antidote protein VapI